MNFEEIVEDVRKEIFETWPEDAKTEFFLLEYNEKSLVSYHHSLGRYIRNKYMLWQVKWEPEIKDNVDYSPNHPDAISMKIMEEVWKRGIKRDGS
jgi:hypothetical protein